MHPLVFIPTYNEAPNIKEICERIRKCEPSCDILFIDDNSTDKTATNIKNLMENDKNIFLIERTKKLGIGSAHQTAIKWAYQEDYRILITMDGDLSHPPEIINRLIDECADNDIVIASRYLDKSDFKEWKLIRRCTAYVSRWLTENLLKLKMDATTAFRCYNLKRIPEDTFHFIQSTDFAFFFESMYVFSQRKMIIKEIPVVSADRKAGRSKLNIVIAVKSFIKLLKIYFKNLTSSGQNR